MADAAAVDRADSTGLRRARGVLALAGGVTAGLGLVVLAGWLLGVERITAVIPGLDPMAFNAALAFGLLGLSLLALAVGRPRPRLALVTGGVVAAYGLLTLVQHAADRTLLPDTIFFLPPDAGPATGRASPNAGLCFLLAGLGVVLLAVGRGLASRLGAALLGTGILVVAVVDLLAYPLSLLGPADGPLMPQMAVHTALGMAIVGGALLDAGWWLPRGLAERPFARVGLAAGTAVALLSVMLAQLLRSQERSQIHGMVQVAAQGIAGQLQRALEARVTTVASIAQALRTVPPRGWESFSAAVLGSTRRGVGWVQPGRRPRWLALLPAEADLRTTPWWPDSGLVTRALADSAPLEAVTRQSGRLWLGLLVRTHPAGGPTGLLWVVTDLRQAMEDELASTSRRFVVVLEQDAVEVARRGPTEPVTNRLWSSRAELSLGTLRWAAVVWPTRGALAAVRSSLPIMTLTGGMLMGLLLGLALAMGRQARQRAVEIGAVNARLTTEIHEREAAEAALHQREEELRQAQKLEAVGRLAGGIAHDYNNILTVIRGNARTLLLRDGMVGLMRDALEHIDRAAARGTLLTARLLAFSQRQLLQPEILSLGDLVAALRDELAQLMGPQVRLVLERVPGPDLVQVDRRWLSQVVLDLCFNGREAMPLGGVLRIRSRQADDASRAEYGVTQVTGPAVMLEIEDSGRGMDEATRGRLFEPFFSTKKFGQGSGLALASAYGIIRQSGGEIVVKSVPDLGTRVGIFLPVAEGPIPAPPPVRLMGATVLVAEDEPGILRFLRRTLEQAGCRVIAGESGEAALAALEQSGLAPDLLISDIVMPGISGVELADTVRASHPGLAVLFVSAYTSDALKRHGIASLGAYLLQKPFTTEELLEQVGRTLALRSSDSPAQ
jgi:signal transduction histidine kinase/ActR/RegA family two-component response regulator